MIRALRLGQWLFGLLAGASFVSFVCAVLRDSDRWPTAATIFIAFCCCAAACGILRDTLAEGRTP
jgi:4-hydroxybenzoate polyprenyltransferase